MKYEPVKDFAERKRILALIERCEKEQMMNKQHMATYINALENRIRELEADRPQGEWIEHKERTIVRDGNFIDFFPTEYECSNCGLREAHYFINSKPHNYCPNCGARMKGADDE